MKKKKDKGFIVVCLFLGLVFGLVIGVVIGAATFDCPESTACTIVRDTEYVEIEKECPVMEPVDCQEEILNAIADYRTLEGMFNE